jgi:hypothetical protein
VYDTLPASWGVGLPDSVVNHDECDLTKSILAAGATPVSSSWRVYASDPQDDGLGWLESVLSPAGLFLVEVQGQLAVRPATNSNGAQFEAVTVWESEIVSLDYQAWDPAAPVEYSRLRAKTPTGESSTTEFLASLPASFERLVELPYVDPSESSWRANVLSRCVGWATRLPEQISVVCRGLGRATVAPGSAIEFQAKRLDPRITRGDWWFVTSCEPDWFGSSVTIRASRIPSVEDAP